ncbi:MAG: ATP-dependent DNA helicase [Thermoplasmata archaeon]|nr:MAG: ATP-dependent DNA helicase [Thermoplasmata archaeon]
MVNFFPYKPRKGQEEIMNAIRKAIEKKQNLVFEAPAGTGKTACALAPSLEFALQNDFAILYLTRTNSQQQQAIKELRRMADINAVGIQGKANMCLLIENIPSLRGSNEEITRLCSARKKKSIEYLRGKKHINRCIFYENFILKRDEIKFNGVISAEEMMEYGRRHKICAYELNKLYMKKARVIIAPYIYLFDEFLREKFITWFPYPFEKTILIIDEAHNLPDFAREVNSISLSYNTVKNAMKEADEYNVRDEDIHYILELLMKIFEEIEEELERKGSEDMFIEKRIEEEMEENGIAKKDAETIAEKMISYGEIIADLKESQNILPRSFLRSIGNFIQRWYSFDDRWVKIAEKGKLEGYCLDASIATSILKEFYCSIHMSGTLEPLDEYKKSIGIEAITMKFPSPFPKENKKVVYVKGVTTKYYMDDEMLDKIGNEVAKICNGIDRNILVFFPSYNILDRFLERNFEIKRKKYVERKNEKQEKLMKKIEEFRKEGGVFLSVIGGRLSEGMDFPSEQAELVIIVGIPYPPPSAKLLALQKYYDDNMGAGKGWKYVVEARATRRMAQAIGRLIRSENDKGMAIILDARANRFRRYIEMEECKDALEEARKFFK